MEDGGSMICLSLATNMTKDEVSEIFKSTMATVRGLKGSTNLITISAILPEFDTSGKEIYEFDHGQRFCKMLVDMGWFGLLMYVKEFGLSVGIEQFESESQRNLAYWVLMAGYGINGEIDMINVGLPLVRQSCNAFNLEFDPQI